jgi:hypothetical protein
MPLKEIDTETIVSRNAEITFTEMDEEIVMVNIDRGEYYGLDNIASDVWGMLEEEMRLMDLCEALSKKYGIETGQCIKDTLPFIREMAENEVVRLS